MKTMRKTWLTVVIVTVSTIATAKNDNPLIRVEKAGVKTFALFTKSVEATQQISIKDAKGHILYNGIIEKEQEYAKRFDLNSLSLGIYTIELENDMQFTAIPFSVNSDSAWVIVDDQVTIFKPTIRQMGDKLDIILPGLVDETMMVTLYDSYYRKLMSEKIGAETLKRLDLSRLEKGNYTIKMTSKGRNFVQSVSIR